MVGSCHGAEGLRTAQTQPTRKEESVPQVPLLMTTGMQEGMHRDAVRKVPLPEAQFSLESKYMHHLFQIYSKDLFWTGLCEKLFSSFRK